MKKLMIAAAIVCAAAMSQAAATQWSFSSLAPDPDAKGLVLNTYLMDAATLSSTKAIEAIEKGDLSFISDALTSGKTQAQGSNIRLSTITTAEDMFTANKSYTLYTVVLNNGADSTYAYVSGEKTAIAPPTGYLQSGSFGSFASGQDYAGEWHSVPEPTSGLLLLLGVAGLALRRRRA